MQQLANRLIPFVLLGVGLVALAFGIIFLTYLFMFGAILGVLLFAINWIRDKLSPPTTVSKKQSQGIVIDADEWHKP